jgi:hypothetical protein
MRIALEFLLDVEPPTATRWRYECTIGWEKRGRGSTFLALVDERFVPISPEEDTWPVLVGAADEWRRERVRYFAGDAPEGFRPPAVALGRPTDADVAVRDRRAGAWRDRDRDDAHTAALAVGVELEHLLVLRLVPDALRKPSPLRVLGKLDSSGEGLPLLLKRIREDTASNEQPDGELSDIGNELLLVIKEVTGFELVEDHVRQDVRVRFAARHDEGFEAAQASDGTLRALAILAALHDPQPRGTLVVEEPEDGIYPERMPTFLTIMREDACRPDADPADAPLRQLIITTHSPAAANAVPREHLVVFESATRVGPGLPPSRVTVPRRVLRDGERPVREPFAVPPVSEAELAVFTGRRG